MDTRIQDMLEDEVKDRNFPEFEAGDTIRVTTREQIGGQLRTRSFEGVCIGRQGKGPNRTFKVRKNSFGVGIERIFPLYAEIIEDIEIIRKGKVRRSKLSYLAGRSQKDSRIKQQRVDLEEVNRVEDLSNEPETEVDESTDEASGEPVDTEEETDVDDNVKSPEEAVEIETDVEEARESKETTESEGEETDDDEADKPQTAEEERQKEEVGESV